MSRNDVPAGEIEQWKDMMSDSGFSEELKELIKEFFIPFSIDPMKFLVNTDATTDPFRYLMYEDEPLFSKALRDFLEDPSLRAFGYPDWFYLAFPDVVMWATGDGKSKVLDYFKDFRENKVIDSETNKINHDNLKSIILMFLNDGKKLECGIG